MLDDMFPMLPSTAITRRRNNPSESMHTLRSSGIASAEIPKSLSLDARSFATRLLHMPFLALAGP